MIYFYDEALERFSGANDEDRHILLNDIADAPGFFERESQDILDMTEYGAKVQFSLMNNGFTPHYAVITAKPERYLDMVPSHKIIDVRYKE